MFEGVYIVQNAETLHSDLAILVELRTVYIDLLKELLKKQ